MSDSSFGILPIAMSTNTTIHVAHTLERVLALQDIWNAMGASEVRFVKEDKRRWRSKLESLPA
jgi:hypothetical protein